MSKKPEISVVMSVYREAVPVLDRSLRSILEQTFSDFEFVIVIDEPDNSEAIELLNNMASQDPRIKLIFNSENLGLAPSLNRGIEHAEGKYIARHDADDVSLPDRLALQSDFMKEHPEADAVGTGLGYYDGYTDELFFVRKYSERVGDEIKRYSPIAHATIFVKKEVFEKFGGYDESEAYRCGEDYELWCRWYLKGVSFYNLNLNLYKYYQYENNNKSINTRRQLRATINTKKKYAGFLEYSVGDRLYMCLEQVASLLPGKVIIFLFKVSQKLMNRN